MRRRLNRHSQLNLLYDHLTDVLRVSKGQPVLTDSVALNEEIILQLDPLTKEIVGFSIVDFLKRFANQAMPASVPIAATFERARKRKMKKRVPRANTKASSSL